MIPIRISVLLLTFLLLLCTVSCSRREKSSPAAEVQKGRAISEQRAAEGITKGTAAEAVESELIPLEAISSAATRDARSGPLMLPASFGRRTGDLDQMIKERRIRALVVINPISFFYSHGKPNGMTYEMLEQLQLVVNKKFNRGKFDVKVMFLPMRPDELGPALMQGVGDIIAQGVMITPGRHESLAFTTPTKKNITENIVTGKELANAAGFDDLAGKDIYVNPLTDAYNKLQNINEERAKAGKTPLSVKAADKNLVEDDLIEMVNAGLIPATVAMQHRAVLWTQVLKNVKLHPQLIVAREGELSWVVRSNNPELKELLDEFIRTHGEGTLFGNVLLRHYLLNTKWIRNSTSAKEMEKFSRYVDYFKRYSAEYSFDYLMVMAQGYQESELDQSARSRVGAVGIMQVIPKYAAAKPVNVPDVKKADKNILAGVRMLNHIATTYFDDQPIDQVNKTLFTFASYNAGPNRIARLRKQAADEGLDPNKWFGNVELEVAKDIGEETVTYVDNIYKYYVAYKLAAEQEQIRKAAKQRVSGK